VLLTWEIHRGHGCEYLWNSLKKPSNRLRFQNIGTLLPHSKKDDHVSICPIKIALIWGLCSYAPTVEPTQVASVGCISHDIPMIFPSYHNKTVTDYPHELLSNDIPIYHQHHCIVSPLVGSFSFPLFHHTLVLLWYWSMIHSHDGPIQNGWGTPIFHHIKSL